MPPAPESSNGNPHYPKHGPGPLIGTIIILVLLVTGAFYAWNERMSREADATNRPPYIPAGTTTLPEINE